LNSAKYRIDRCYGNIEIQAIFHFDAYARIYYNYDRIKSLCPVTSEILLAEIYNPRRQKKWMKERGMYLQSMFA
jgi:hypothetical protein